MKVWFCFGTAGELIKLYPLMKEAEAQGISWFALSTGQSAINLFKQWDDFELDQKKIVVLNQTDSDLDSSSQAFFWFLKSFFTSTSTIKEKIKTSFGLLPEKNDLMLVHGDTLSTLVGSVFAKKLKLKIAHIEAGLRSKSLISPFPEEITRRLVSRLASFHFSQDDTATKNLIRSRVYGKVICTHGNTLIDAIELLSKDTPSKTIPKKPYVVANLHRFENLNSDARWNKMISVLIQTASKLPVYLVQHPPTEAKIENDSETKKKLITAGVHLLPRQPFRSFVQLLHHSDFVLSDGGSNQEECYYMGKPCLILRDATERLEGLENGPCLLSYFEDSKINTFLANPAALKREPLALTHSPSKIIFKVLIAENKKALT